MAANPYVQGWREWDERYADLVLGKRNWQIAAACSMAVSLVRPPASYGRVRAAATCLTWS
jgi:type IV secretory pathway TrbF-like protein